MAVRALLISLHSLREIAESGVQKSFKMRQRLPQLFVSISIFIAILQGN